MILTRTHDLLGAWTFCLLAISARATDSKVEQKQIEIREMAQDTLQRLYKANPKTRAAIKHASGYAVFSNLGVKILVAGSGNRRGLAVDDNSKQEAFMKMLEVQAGLGMSVKKFRVIFVFDNHSGFNNFVNSGWQFGGQSAAAAKVGDAGGSLAGAVSVSDGVWMYQLPPRAQKYYKTTT